VLPQEKENRFRTGTIKSETDQVHGGFRIGDDEKLIQEIIRTRRKNKITLLPHRPVMAQARPKAQKDARPNLSLSSKRDNQRTAFIRQFWGKLSTMGGSPGKGKNRRLGRRQSNTACRASPDIDATEKREKRGGKRPLGMGDVRKSGKSQKNVEKSRVCSCSLSSFWSHRARARWGGGARKVLLSFSRVRRTKNDEDEHSLSSTSGRCHRR